jgi:nucleoside-diphosphate-sugar epimerase
VEASNTDPDTSYQLNVQSLQVVLEAMRNAAVSKIVIISSSAVYGEPQEIPIHEDQRAKPISIYAFHKYIAEKLGEAYSKCYGFQVLITRPFNVFGVNENRVLKQMVTRAVNNLPATIYGENQLRDFIHVDDVAIAISSLLETECAFEIFNIGTGKGRRMQDIFNLVKEHFPGLRMEKAAVTANLYNSVADISKIKQAIYFKPDDSDDKIREVIRELKLKHSNE